MLQGEHQGRQEAEHIGSARAGEYMLLVEQTQAKLLYGLLKFQSYHESAAAHFLYSRQLAQLGEEVIAHLGCVFHQVLFLKNLEHGNGGCTGQVVAAEGGAEHSIGGLERGAD